MIARDIRDYRALRFGEARQLRIGYQIKRVFLVRFVCDVITDVMQQRAGEHERTMMPREIFSWRQTLEDLFGQFCDLARMSFFITETTPDRVHAAQVLIPKIRRRWTRLIFPFTQTVDDHAFSEGPLTGPYHVDAQRAHRRFQDVTTGDD